MCSIYGVHEKWIQDFCRETWSEVSFLVFFENNIEMNHKPMGKYGVDVILDQVVMAGFCEHDIECLAFKTTVDSLPKWEIMT